MKEKEILKIIKINNNMVPTSKLCKELGLHYYAALRKLEELEKEGIIESQEFGSDKRRIRVWSLSDKNGKNKPNKNRNVKNTN